MATWSYEGQGSFAFTSLTDTVKDPTTLFTATKADIQADLRSAHIINTDTTIPPRNILMEASLKAAIHFGKTTDIVVSHGAYGAIDNEQQRTYYLAVRASKYLSFHVGRFLPAYGIYLDDHTSLIRGSLGFGQGQESINLSSHFETETVQTTLTKVFGQDVNLESATGRFAYSSDSLDRYIIRTALKPNSKSIVGFSGLVDSGRRLAGLFAQYAPFKYLYLMAQYDSERIMEGDIRSGRNIYFLRAGSEVYRGVTLGLDLSAEKSDIIQRNRIESFIHLLPTPHVSFRFGARVEGDQINLIGTTHLWL
jgi:hypothetical protein